MTVSSLIDYLNQFGPETTVLLSDSDATGEEFGDYIVLDRLDYSPSGEDAAEVEA